MKKNDFAEFSQTRSKSDRHIDTFINSEVTISKQNDVFFQEFRRINYRAT